MTSLSDYFDKFPALQFDDGSDTDEELRFPALNADSGLRNRLSSQNEDWSQDALLDLSAVTILKQEVGLEMTRQMLRGGLRKFRFGTETVSHWEDFTRFSGDRVQTERSRAGRKICNLVECSEDVWEEGMDVNRSRPVALDWFENHLLPVLDTDGSKHSTFLFGQPGCGKSTFMKYLLTTRQETFQQEGFVFSRFEFLKYKRRLSEVHRENVLSEYMSFIHLRDLLTLKFFNTSNPKGRMLQGVYGGAKPSRKRVDEKCCDIEKEALTVLGALKLDMPNVEIQQQIFQAVWSGRRSTKEFHQALNDVDHDVRLVVSKVLLGTRTLVTVFDGLDTVSVDEVTSDNETNKLILEVLHNRADISRIFYPSKGPYAYSSASIVIMRENTLGILERIDDQIGKARTKQYFIGEIDPRVALQNSIARSVEHAVELGVKIPDPEKAIADTFTGVERTLNSLPRGSGRRAAKGDVYEIFCGNFRELIGFISILFKRTVQDLRNKNLLSARVSRDPNKLMEMLLSREIFEVMQRKNYRMLEWLMFSRLPWFENAVQRQEADPYIVNMTGKNTPTKLKMNSAYSGFVDNIFNYHVKIHRPEASAHCLLEKIRVLQLLERKKLNWSELQTRLRNVFGYESPDLTETLAVLQKVQLITTEISRNNADEKIKLTITGRGKFCLYYLLYNVTFLEHVYHRTLLPARLLRDSPDDYRRPEASYKWAARSIANVYALLTYVNFVESNLARDKVVPQEYRITEKMARNVKAAVTRIIRYDEKAYGKHDDYDPGETIESLARKDIQGFENLWRIRGLNST